MTIQKRAVVLVTAITLGSAAAFGAVVVNGEGGESRDPAVLHASRGTAPLATLETGVPRIDPTAALIRSEIDGATFLVGPRLGGNDLCFTVDVPSEVTMAGCKYSEDLVTKGAVYTASRDREPTVKTLYGIAPEGAVRMTAGDVVADVKDRAFIVTVPRSVQSLDAVRADGSESAFPLATP